MKSILNFREPLLSNKSNPLRRSGIEYADKLFLEKIEKLVEANLDIPDFRNQKLASNMMMSESKLFRKLKALTNKSVAIYIRGIRLKKARKLLCFTDQTVSEVAYKTGFNDPSYFSRTFSKEFGFPPSSARSKFNSEGLSVINTSC